MKKDFTCYLAINILFPRISSKLIVDVVKGASGSKLKNASSLA